MRWKLVLLLILLFRTTAAISQNLVYAEYFINTDPGYGNATQIAITPAPDITNISFTTSIAALANGFHHVYVRVKDANDIWSLTNVKAFYKESLLSTVPNIVQAEYFLNTDPGFGNGTAISISPAPNITGLSYTVDLSSLGTGFHHLYVRVKDATGKWSLTNVKPFYKEALQSSLPNIVEAEYFLNTDPGLGNATPISISPAPNLTGLSYTVDLSSLGTGFHHLYVRVKDATGKWSLTNVKPFYKEALQSNLPNIVEAEYFLNTDPGFGNATAISISPAVNLTSVSYTVDLSSLGNGFHHLYARVKDATGKWSLTNAKPFYKEALQSSLPNIVEAEYFLNTDPGFGNATSISISPAPNLTSVSYTVDLSSLGNGFHHLYARVKDATGKWSLTNVKPFYKEKVYLSAQNIVKVEYFINTDPGLGNAINVPIQPNSDLNMLEITADAFGLLNGTNYLFVRVQDENGQWSLTNRKEFVVSCPNLSVDFSATEGCEGQLLHFSDSSTNIYPYAQYFWDFGDGTPIVNAIKGDIEHAFFSSGNFNVTLIGQHSVECIDTITKSVVVNPFPDPAVVPSGSTTVCQGQSSVLYTAPAIINADSYVWYLPSGVSGSSTTNSIVVDFGTSAISGNITVRGWNQCGGGIVASLPVTVNPLPAMAGNIIGNDTVCEGQNSVSYSVPLIAYTDTYIWTLPNGATGTSFTNAIDVGYNTYPIVGNISVKGINTCGDGVSSTLPIIENPLPLSAGIITGNTTVCQGQNAVTYTVPQIGNAETYTWVLPTGAIGTSNTNSIDVDFNTAAVSGNITVRGTNSCGHGVISTLAITVNPTPISTAVINDASCFDFSNGWINIDVTGGTLPYSYLWSGGQTVADIYNQAAGEYTVTVTGANGCAVTENYTVSEPLNPVAVTSTIVDVACFGNSTGSIAMNVYGGTSPYIYVWSNGATTNNLSNVPKGLYSVQIVDANNCLEIESYLVDGPDVISILGTTNDVSCFGYSNGSIDLELSGGVSPYYFLWGNGQTNEDIQLLDTGNYVCSIMDANGCTTQYLASINEPAELQSVLTASDYNGFGVSCYGSADGFTTLSVSGGTSPYNYQWNSGATTSFLQNIGSGNYTVTITDLNGCESYNESAIVEPDPIQATEEIYNVSQFGVSDGSISLSISGGLQPYSSIWNNLAMEDSISGLSAGTYSITLTDANGCNLVESYVITEPPYNTGPGWNYTITGTTHSVLIQDTIPLTINGVQISTGDFIGVFYDSLGEFVCGGYAVWNNSSTVLTAWGEDIGDDGFVANENFNWKIWRQSDDQEFSANATYIPAPDMPNQGLFEINGLSGLTSLEAVVVDSQLINLGIGWSIFSTYIDPFEPNVASVLSSIVSHVIIAKDGQGFSFWPQFGVNMIGNISIGKGYQIKVTMPQSFSITGIAVQPESTPVIIPQGWSFLGYLRKTPTVISSILSPVVAEILVVKNSVGAVYWPQFGVNSIGNMNPGEGYQIKMSSQQSLIYPANTVAFSKVEIVEPEPLHFQRAINTGNNMTLGIPLIAYEDIPNIGSEVGVFDQFGKLVGSTVFMGGNLAIAVWGNDDLSSETDGLLNGNDFCLRLWDGETEKDLSVEKWTEGDGRYYKDDIQIVDKLILVDMDELDYKLDQNEPNPFNTSSRISFFLPTRSEVNLTVFDILGNAIEVLAKGTFPAGKHTVEVMSTKYANGNYFYRMIANDFVETKQMEVTK